MTTSTWAFGRGSTSSHLRLFRQSLKRYSTASTTAPSNSVAVHQNSHDAQSQRDLFVNVLNAHATKRDARQYLARFEPSKRAPPGGSTRDGERNAGNNADQGRLQRHGVNLGGLYSSTRAISETPTFSRQDVKEKSTIASRSTIHTALVCLPHPEELNDSTLNGVALTLSQLVKLDMRIVVILDVGTQSTKLGTDSLRELKTHLAEQGDRLRNVIDKHSPDGARIVDGSIELRGSHPDEGFTIGVPKIVLDPLERSVILIVPTLAYTSSGQTIHASAPHTMIAMSRLLSDLPKPSNTPPGDEAVAQTSLDRIIVLDSIGGIPSRARGDGAHVFINLDQEFEDIQEELNEYSQSSITGEHAQSTSALYLRHQANLRMLRDCLMMLPSSSSALIISPEEAANSSNPANENESTIGAGTRRQKNTLIHNLLTNKPTVSSSLPVARMPSSTNVSENLAAEGTPGSTLVKRGMPITIIPTAPRPQGWSVPKDGQTTINLETDPRIDLARLVYLIEDSFRRKLDLRHYLTRIQNRIAGLIIAGSYEGAAILTWEQPPGTSDPSRLVPYLDKFAVLSSSQGSSGVADILFQAMVRTGFPQGVCWRSRKDNPVNKWYFERAQGHFQIPASNWTMFWTGDGIVESEERWTDYVGVCKSVGASWADNSKKPD